MKTKFYTFIFKDGHTETERGMTPGDAFRKLGYSLADTDLVANWEKLEGGSNDE